MYLIESCYGNTRGWRAADGVWADMACDTPVRSGEPSTSSTVGELKELAFPAVRGDGFLGRGCPDRHQPIGGGLPPTSQLWILLSGRRSRQVSLDSLQPPCAGRRGLVALTELDAGRRWLA